VDESRQNIMEKAESRFLETQKKTADRAKATIEYQAEAKLRAVKTARLRELQLAKDEAERAAELLKPDAPKKKRASHR
jgi:predicted negative regulator of RcsB-dependent stress response